MDVTIMGAGAFGLACGWEMIRRGAQVRIVDRVGVGAGSSGGVVGALAPHVPENWNAKKAFQLESLLAAPAFWTEVVAAGGVDAGYARTGRLQPVIDAPGLDLAHQRALGAQDLWQGRAEWTVVSSVDFAGWAPPSPTGWLIRDTLSALLNPALACAALAAAIKARGGVIDLDNAAPDQPSGSASDKLGPILWATGADGLAALNRGADRAMGAGVKGQAALFELDRRGAPQLFSDGVHIIPHSDGTVAVGSTTERTFDDGTKVDDALDPVIDLACRVVPELGKAPILRRWAGVRPRARSRAPMLGAWPGHPGHYVANGGFKIGFGMAPGVARTMADLILEGRDTIPEGFRVTDNL